jgi:hypothetical protein
MTELTPEAQAVVDAYEQTNDKYFALAAVLRAAVDILVPEEKEAPRAQFDCPPRKLYNFGKKEEKWGYEHGDYLRRQFAQDELNIRWEQRQQTRALALAIITELEAIKLCSRS